MTTFLFIAGIICAGIVGTVFGWFIGVDWGFDDGLAKGEADRRELAERINKSKGATK